MLVKEEEIERLEPDIKNAPNSQSPINQNKEMFSLMCQFMRNPNRDIVCDLLKYNRPSEQYLITWLELLKQYLQDYNMSLNINIILILEQ